MPGLLDEPSPQGYGTGLLGYGNPVVYRGAIIPRVETADGTTGWGWPQMALDAYQAMKAPGDVWQGKLDPRSQEGQERAMNLAGLLTLGSGAIPKAAGSMNMGIGKPIKAFHGSPHDFNAFDMSKIGTGQGAQTYGHGLYFAENEGVARSYRDALSHLTQDELSSVVRALPDKYRGSGAIPKPGGTDNAHRIVKHIRGAVNAGDIKTPSQYLTDFDVGELGAAYKIAADVLENKGRMYEVNLHADPNKFLDWDKPLSGQGADVRGALEQFGFKAQPEQMRQFDDALLAALDGTGPTKLPKQPPDPLGANIYESSKIVPGMYRDKVRAANNLREAGIPGIKYLDQGSRNAGGWHITPPDQTTSGKWMVKSSDYNSKGLHFDAEDAARKALAEKTASETRNFAVFDPKIIEIVRKYGLGALGLTGLLGAQEGEQTQ